MLALTRKVGESILVGDDIEIKIAEIGRGRVKLAITAPRELRIRRQEITPAKVESITPDLGICPNCESAEVTEVTTIGEGVERLICTACGARWSGVRRRLAA